eukprot:18282-Heterococcus_DN1.PRE.3
MQCILVSGYFEQEVVAARTVIATVSTGSMNEVKAAMQTVQNVFSTLYTPHSVANYTASQHI